MPTLNLPTCKQLSIDISNQNSTLDYYDNIQNSNEENTINSSREDRTKFTHNFNFLKNIRD